MAAPRSLLQKVEEAIKVVERLRAPGGCPWDREQDHISLRPYLLEEAYEAQDALDGFIRDADPKTLARTEPNPKGFVKPSGSFRSKDAQDKFQEELGDVLLQVLLHAQFASERGEFDFGDVAKTLAQKLVFRHPHVFQKKAALSTGQVLSNWEVLKKQEKGLKLGSNSENKTLVSALDGLPKALPSLQKASRIGEKAKGVGFDWPSEEGVLNKVREEIRELEEALELKDEKAIEHELGDVFFSLCNLSRWRRLDPEALHQKAISRFEKRFRLVEESFALLNKDMRKSSLEDLDAAWEKAKLLEKTFLVGLTGNIASGKSTVAKMLHQLGIPVVDADQVSREILSPGKPGYEAVLAEFGKGILLENREIDRKKLGAVVFADEEKRKRLEALTHPLIGAQSRKVFTELAAQGHKVVVYEATLLLESGRGHDFDALILVNAPQDLQKKWLLARNHAENMKATKTDAARRLKSQTLNSMKSKIAESIFSPGRLFLISNDHDLKSLSRQVDEVAKSLKTLSRK